MIRSSLTRSQRLASNPKLEACSTATTKDRVPVVSARADHGAIVIREYDGAVAGKKTFAGRTFFIHRAQASGEKSSFMCRHPSQKSR